jgi:DNA-binding XRE family transcriptional regulator
MADGFMNILQFCCANNVCGCDDCWRKKMAHLPKNFCREVAEARRARGMTQSALARSVGCRQSAVSMFEGGRADKLSMDSVRKIAAILEIPLEGTQSAESAGTSAACGQKVYCPNPACLGNIPCCAGDVLMVWPSVAPAAEGAVYCRICGEVLERACPECGRPVGEGAFCAACGRARIAPAVPEGLSAPEWMAQRRMEIRQWRELTQM